MQIWIRQRYRSLIKIKKNRFKSKKSDLHQKIDFFLFLLKNRDFYQPCCWDTSFELLTPTMGLHTVVLSSLRKCTTGRNVGQNRGSGQIFTPNKFDLAFEAPTYCAIFHPNWIKIAAVEAHTDTETDASDSIICPMLCYSNGTDNYKYQILVKYHLWWW